MRKLILRSLLLLLPVISFGQKKSTIDSLRSELSRARLELDALEEKANRLEYLLASKEMAIRSIELKDSLYQDLVAVQAYKFNLNHKGSPTDIDVYRAMYASLKRFKDPMVSVLKYEVDERDKELPNRMKEMAKRLCSKLKRNMSVEQWDKFASHLPYEATCSSK